MSNIDKNVIHVFNLPTTMVGEAAVLDTVGGNTVQKKVNESK